MKLLLKVSAVWTVVLKSLSDIVTHWLHFCLRTDFFGFLYPGTPQAASTKTWTHMSQLLSFFFFFSAAGFPAAVLQHSSVMDSKTKMEKEILRGRIAMVFEFLYDTKFWSSAAVKSLWTRDSCSPGLGGLYGGEERFSQPTRACAGVFACLFLPPFPPSYTIIPRGRTRVGVSLQTNAPSQESSSHHVL